MIKLNIIMIQYTKSFDRLSPLVVDFIQGVESGIVAIDLFDGKGRLVKTLAVPKLSKDQGWHPSFYIGYYPQGLARGIDFSHKFLKLKKLQWKN